MNTFRKGLDLLLGAICCLVLCSVQASETVVMGNHVVSGRHRLLAYSAVDN